MKQLECHNAGSSERIFMHQQLGVSCAGRGSGRAESCDETKHGVVARCGVAKSAEKRWRE